MYTAGMNVDRMHNYVGVAHNAEKFAFALQWTNAGMADIMQTNIDGQDLGEFDYGDNAIALSLAKRFDVVSLGVTGKYLRQSVGADVSGDDAVNGFGLDIGLGMVINEWARFGLAVQNIAGQLGSVDEVNTIPATLRAGVALMPMQGLTTAFDIEKTRDEEDYRFHAGAEMAVPVTDNIGTALRVGLNHDKFSGGMGLSFNFLSFDYAYVVEPEEFLDENHRLSVSLKFGDEQTMVSSRDRDGDGIMDRDDQCPDLAEDFDGFADTDGCPDLDNDGDGIPDVNDDCPNQAEDFDGFQDTDGCPDPDNDGDGIMDKDDRCPTQAEVFNQFEDTDGCPDEVPVTLPTLAYINFKFGTAEISGADPIPVLEEVARIMKERPGMKVKITGHTDNVGSDQANMALSMRRAQAVKTYLVTKGVEDARLITEGLGESNPIDTNDSDVGRARNRRIEFSVIE
jgi:outer membrane protein OmpA-like peptidoglycan-associated protein